MAELRTAPSISGEIMAGPEPQPAFGRRLSADIVDADYVEVRPEPRADQPRTAAVAAAPRPEAVGMAILGRAEAARRPRFEPAGPAFWLGGAAIAFAAFWVSGGHAAFGGATFLSSASAASRLRIENVTSRSQLVDGMPALLVDGDVSNDGAAAGVVPGIAIHVTSVGGATWTYRLGTSPQSLAANAKFSFSSRLDMPKDGVKTVSVAFDP